MGTIPAAGARRPDRGRDQRADDRPLVRRRVVDHDHVTRPQPRAPGVGHRRGGDDAAEGDGPDEYGRSGTANLFVAFEPVAGWRRYQVTERRTRPDFARFVRDLLDGPYKYAAKVVLVMDNPNTHDAARLYAAFPPAEARRPAGWRSTTRPSTAAG